MRAFTTIRAWLPAVAVVVLGCAGSVAAQAPGAAANQGGRAAASTPRSPAANLEDVERRLGPFAVGPYGGPVQTLRVIERLKQVAGSPPDDPDTQALVSLEIVDPTGAVHHREAFDYSLDDRTFASSCSASMQFLQGNVASGLLVASGCAPSAPDAGDTWELFGVVNNQVRRFGKPFTLRGQVMGLSPTPVSQIGTARLIRPDSLAVKVRTEYFFVTTSLKVDWLQGTVAPGDRCYGQTGQGLREQGCEVPVEGERILPGQKDTFVRLFTEATEESGVPRHILVRTASVIELVAAKVRFVWDEGTDITTLEVDEDDTWLQLRIDGEEGWIHTREDFAAIGLRHAG